jgi:hypothetical protein
MRGIPQPGFQWLLSHELPFQAGQAKGRAGSPGYGGLHAANAAPSVGIDHGSCRGEGKVAMPSRDFHESTSGAGRESRNVRRMNKLVIGQSRFKRPAKELSDRHFAYTSR